MHHQIHRHRKLWSLGEGPKTGGCGLFALSAVVGTALSDIKWRWHQSTTSCRPCGDDDKTQSGRFESGFCSWRVGIQMIRRLSIEQDSLVGRLLRRTDGAKLGGNWCCGDCVESNWCDVHDDDDAAHWHKVFQCVRLDRISTAILSRVVQSLDINVWYMRIAMLKYVCSQYDYVLEPRGIRYWHSYKKLGCSRDRAKHCNIIHSVSENRTHTIHMT